MSKTTSDSLTLSRDALLRQLCLVLHQMARENGPQGLDPADREVWAALDDHPVVDRFRKSGS